MLTTYPFTGLRSLTKRPKVEPLYTELEAARLTEKLVDNVARGLRNRSSLGSLALAHAGRDRANAEGRGGRRPKPACKGAVGVAGFRADLADGSLTIVQLRGMTLSQIARRYGVTVEYAGQLKRKTLAR